jgi:hypothetical protein
MHRRAGGSNLDRLNINPDALIRAAKYFLKRFSNFSSADDDDNRIRHASFSSVEWDGLVCSWIISAESTLAAA